MSKLMSVNACVCSARSKSFNIISGILISFCCNVTNVTVQWCLLPLYIPMTHRISTQPLKTLRLLRERKERHSSRLASECAYTIMIPIIYKNAVWDM